MGHVNHEAIIGYLAHARVIFIDMMVDRVSLKEVIDYVLAKLSIDFLLPITYPGIVTISSSIEKIGNKSITSLYEMEKNGIIFAKAKCTNVFFNVITRKNTTIPRSLRDEIEWYIDGR